MTSAPLNLAARPFTNDRPVKRTTLLLWLLAVGLLALNIFLYQRHLSGQHEQRQAIAVLQQRISEEQRETRRLAENLARLELAQQNRQVVFLNSQIARRTFSWSRLFDRLAEVMPQTVQLRRVSPRIVEERQRENLRSEVSMGEVVAIDLGGVARSSEAILELVDNLFEHPSFIVPNLTSESEKEKRGHEFTLDVLYLPAAREDS